MDDLELLAKMKKVIAERFDVDEEKITLESDLRKDFGADSLDTYELIYDIEGAFNVTVPDETANELVTVRNAYDYIKEQLKEQQK